MTVAQATLTERMKRLIPILILGLVLGLAASASANVLVYKNNFGDRKDFAQINKFGGGKQCKSFWRDKNALGLDVRRGRSNCGLRTPVEGDRNRPDHTVQVIGKVLKSTNKKIAGDVYMGVALRANSKSAYELRIFPKGRTWTLIKNGAELDSGKDGKAINALGSNNKVRLVAENDRIVAKANGKALTKFKDQAPQEVKGRKVVLTGGTQRKTKKDAHVVFDKIRVLVPDPR